MQACLPLNYAGEHSQMAVMTVKSANKEIQTKLEGQSGVSMVATMGSKIFKVQIPDLAKKFSLETLIECI